MGVLSELLRDPAKRRAIVDDGVQVIHQEVADKQGLTGLAVKGAFKMVDGLRPDFIRRALDHLMPAFAEKIDPFYDDWRASQRGSLRDYFLANGGRIANALLSITDDRARNADNKVVRKAYDKLRPQGVEHTVAAMPRLAAMVERHTGGGRS